MRVTLGGAGYPVADARNGEEALEKLRDERFDLVLLDVNLPGITGIETCRKIRAQSDVPVTMLTVRNSNQDAVAAQDAGADDYVTKPFSMEVRWRAFGPLCGDPRPRASRGPTLSGSATWRFAWRPGG